MLLNHRNRKFRTVRALLDGAPLDGAPLAGVLVDGVVVDGVRVDSWLLGWAPLVWALLEPSSGGVGSTEVSDCVIGRIVTWSADHVTSSDLSRSDMRPVIADQCSSYDCPLNRGLAAVPLLVRWSPSAIESPCLRVPEELALLRSGRLYGPPGHRCQGAQCLVQSRSTMFSLPQIEFVPTSYVHQRRSLGHSRQ